MSKKDIARKSALMAVTGIFFALLSVSVCAQTTPVPAPATPAAQGQPQVQGGQKADVVQPFSARKQMLLKNIGEHIARMQQKQSCIQSAIDEKALKACLPGGDEGDHREPAQPPLSGQQPGQPPAGQH